MTAPFLTISVAMVYFGWLWHDRHAAGRATTHEETKTVTRAKRPRIRRLKLLQRKPFKWKHVRGAVR